jgi:hypothetical protein
LVFLAATVVLLGFACYKIFLIEKCGSWSIRILHGTTVFLVLGISVYSSLLSRMKFNQLRKKMNQQICYCFGYTIADLERDVKKHGRSTIMARIIAEKKAGGCRCAEKNPAGR